MVLAVSQTPMQEKQNLPLTAVKWLTQWGLTKHPFSLNHHVKPGNWFLDEEVVIFAMISINDLDLDQFPAQSFQKTSSICACSCPYILIHLISPAHTNPHLPFSLCHQAEGWIFLCLGTSVVQGWSENGLSDFFFLILPTRSSVESVVLQENKLTVVLLLISNDKWFSC